MRISDTLSSVAGNFARPTKFNVLITPPSGLKGGGEFEKTVDILAKSVEVPEIIMSPIELTFKGHQLKYPARVNQTQSFSVTFYTDEYYNIRKMFTNWISILDNRYYVGRSNDTANLVDSSEKYGNMMIIARDFNEKEKPMVFMFENVFPTNIGNITFDSSDKDSIIETTVTFAYYRFLNSDETYDGADTYLDTFGLEAISKALSSNGISPSLASSTVGGSFQKFSNIVNLGTSFMGLF
jgi:hypothetical protein